jgi:hypothetical protein
VNSIAVVIDATTFGATCDYGPLLAGLSSAGIPTYRVRRDDPLDRVLSQSPEFAGRR